MALTETCVHFDPTECSRRECNHSQELDQHRKEYSRLAQLDQILVCGTRVQPTYVKVGLAQLLSSAAAAVTAAVGVGTGGCHLLAGGHIGLLKRKYGLCLNIVQVD